MQAIVAADNNWGIGYQNRLLESIPSDMKFFRQKTTGNVVVMGRKTLESFPNGLPLKNRVNIVLTKNKNYQVKDAVIVHSEEELLEELKKYPSEKIYAKTCPKALTSNHSLHAIAAQASRFAFFLFPISAFNSAQLSALSFKLV